MTNLEYSLIYLVGICVGIPIGIVLEKIKFSFWKKRKVEELE